MAQERSVDLADSLVSIGGHAYRKDIRQSAYRFLNTYLKNDSRPVLDSEVDLVTSAPNEVHPIPPEQLRVFPQDSDFPRDAINSRIDHEFVPMATAEPPKEGGFQAWKDERLAKLRRLTFHHLPTRIPPAVPVETNSSGVVRLTTEPGISIQLRPLLVPRTNPRRVWVLVANSGAENAAPGWFKDYVNERTAIYLCEPRGIGSSQWTTKNPPNYVERSHYLLGRTVDSGRVWDLAATAAYLRARHGERCPVCFAGEGGAAVLAVYGALLEPEVGGLVLFEAPGSHMESTAPVLLNVLRVCDVPEAVGMLAPRSVRLLGPVQQWSQRTAALYRSAGAGDRFAVE